MSARFPIKNGLLQSDLDCAHFKLLNLDSTATKTPTELGVNKEVWITIRTDGSLGTGTLSDPYDGSTQARFDAAIATYFNANTTNIMFNIGVGNFSSKGQWSGNWSMLSGWHFRGSGIGLTTITQVAGVAGVAKPVFNHWSNTETNLSVEDMTIDCAYVRSHASYADTTKFEAITLIGANSFVRNVKVINAGVENASGEAFPILIFDGGADTGIPDNALVEGCEVSSCGPHCTAIGIANGRATLAKNGRIIRNYINGANFASGPPGGFSESLIEENIFTGCTRSIWQDSYSVHNCLINSNIMDQGGIAFVNTAAALTYSNIKITNNILGCSANDDAGVQFTGLGAGTTVTNVEIAGNRIYKSGSPTPVYSVYLDATTGTISNIRIVDNTIDSTLSDHFVSATAVTFSGNRTAAGAVITNMPDSTTAGLAFYNLANPGAITFPRINADNSVTARSAANFKTDLGITSATTANALQNLSVKSIDPAADPTNGQVLGYNSGTGKWEPQTVAGGAGGTVTSVSVVSANNFTGSVATATSTPAITLTYTPPTAYARLVAATTAIVSSSNAYTIDWSTTTSFTHTLTENVVYAFSNTADNYDIVVRILNSSSNYTVAWPSGIKWQTGSAPTMTIGAKYDIVTLIKQGSVISGAIVQNLS